MPGQRIIVAPEQLRNAVLLVDKVELERICLALGTYQAVVDLAAEAGISHGELEDALQEI